MAKNPFDDDSAPTVGRLRPGDQMIIPVRDKDKQLLYNVVLRRTDRPYCYDLRDAYNQSLAERDPDMHNRLEYAVGVNDQIYLRERQSANGKPEEEFYEPTPEDLASIKAYIAKAMARGMTQEEFNAHVRRTGGAPRR